MMAGIEKHRTPLLVQMDKLGKAIFILILVMMAALFVFSLLFRDMPVSELMLSLISLAVGIGPGRVAGDYLDYSVARRTGDGPSESDYPQAADGGNPRRDDGYLLG
ncbi:cation-transporting P-type ATPase [Klebsiella pneumoniae]|nr:cation-transporting P-type ATPase [Klebsiella pneumoniae]